MFLISINNTQLLIINTIAHTRVVAPTDFLLVSPQEDETEPQQQGSRCRMCSAWIFPPQINLRPPQNIDKWKRRKAAAEK